MPCAWMAWHKARVVLSSLAMPLLPSYTVFRPSVISTITFCTLAAGVNGRVGRAGSHTPCHLGERVNQPHISPTLMRVSPTGRSWEKVLRIAFLSFRANCMGNAKDEKSRLQAGWVTPLHAIVGFSGGPGL